MSDMRAWQESGGGWTAHREMGIYTRPVLVIDPENDEHVRALVGAMREHGWTGMDDEAAGDMRNVLRSLLTPPKTKLAEPDEHGAKVIDGGVQYVAARRYSGGWDWFPQDDGMTWKSWSDFSDDVEVVS